MDDITLTLTLPEAFAVETALERRIEALERLISAAELADEVSAELDTFRLLVRISGRAMSAVRAAIYAPVPA